MFKDRVLYACSCSQLSPLSDLYFCRHCKVPRCQECVFSTVESFSCHHCFEACSVSTELKSKKGRCSHCFQCPRCSSTLTTRSIIVPSDVFSQSELSAPKDSISPSSTARTPLKSGTTVHSTLKSPGGTKVYFLSCSHCKWSTRDVSLKDKRSPADFKDKVSDNQTRVSELILFYKEYAIQDVAEHEKVKKPFAARRPRTFGGLLDSTKFKLSSDSPRAKRRIPSQIQWNSNICEKMKAMPSDHHPPSDDLYSKPLCLAETSSMAQRFRDPSVQPSSVSGFVPHQLFLITKKLHRCNGCDHILIKAEMNPGSIRFKIQQIAWHVFPHVCIVDNPTLKVGEESVVHLSISNPVSHSMAVSFYQCDSNRITVKETISPCSVPNGLFFLTPNDDLGDLLNIDDNIKDDPQFVFSRHPGKIVLKFRVTPKDISQSVKFMFEMVFSHKPMIEADQNYGETEVKVPVLVRLLKCKEVCST